MARRSDHGMLRAVRGQPECRHAHSHRIETGEREIGDAAIRLLSQVTSVRGPGQNAAASFSAAGVNTPTRRAASTFATCAIKGSFKK